MGAHMPVVEEALFDADIVDVIDRDNGGIARDFAMERYGNEFSVFHLETLMQPGRLVVQWVETGAEVFVWMSEDGYEMLFMKSERHFMKA